MYDVRTWGLDLMTIPAYRRINFVLLVFLALKIVVVKSRSRTISENLFLSDLFSFNLLLASIRVVSTSLIEF